MSDAPRHPESRSAFTLVELLVVVAIIVAMLAILVPSMGRAVLIAQRASCASNLHQLYVASMSYAADGHGVLPASGWGTDFDANVGRNQVSLHVWNRWVADPFLERYLDNRVEVFMCPVADVDAAVVWDYAARPASRLSLCMVTTTSMLDPAQPPGSNQWLLNGKNYQLRTVRDDPSKMFYADLIRWNPSAVQWNLGDRILTADGNPEGQNRMNLDGAVRWSRWAYLQGNYAHGGIPPPPPGCITGSHRQPRIRSPRPLRCRGRGPRRSFFPA